MKKLKENLRIVSNGRYQQPINKNIRRKWFIFGFEEFYARMVAYKNNTTYAMSDLLNFIQQKSSTL